MADSSSTTSTPERPVAARARGRARGRGGSRSRSRGRGGRGSRPGSRSRSPRVGAAAVGDTAHTLQIVQSRSDRLKGMIAGMSEARMREVLLELLEVQPSLVFSVLEPPQRQPGGYHPASGDAPDWCVCGRCREMPSDREKVCCETEECVSLLPEFTVYVLDPGVLALARLYRQDILVMDEDEADMMKANRHAAYRQFTLWYHGRLGAGNRVVIPSCCVWGIRDKYPDPFGQYKGFVATRLA